MKKALNLGKAGVLLEKLIKDTENNVIRWEKRVPDGEKAESRKDSGNTKLKNYIFDADIDGSLSAHVQNHDENVRVWMERNGERIYVSDDLYEYPSIVSLVNKLHHLVRFYSDVQIMKEIDKYIGVPFDEKAYLVDDEKEEK